MEGQTISQTRRVVWEELLFKSSELGFHNLMLELALFLLAFQLRKQGDGVTGFVFPERDLLSSVNNVGYETLDKEISAVSVRVPVPLPTESFSESKKCYRICFSGSMNTEAV